MNGWMDLTLSPAGEMTVSREPDGSVEIEVRDEELRVFMSLVLTPGTFARLADEIAAIRTQEPDHAAEDR